MAVVSFEGGQIKHGQQRLLATLEFADRVSKIAHFSKSLH